MTDRERNLNMAEVCGIPVSSRDIDQPDPLIIAIGECLELYAKPDVKAVDWNPVGNWQQVFEYVVRALDELGCRTCLDRGLADAHHAVPIERVPSKYSVQISKGDRGVGFMASGNDSPRALCEAAWEAWQKLEKS